MEQIKSLLRHEVDAIMNIPVNDSYHKSIALIHQRVHMLGGKVVTSGIGKAGQIAVNIATTFCATGTPAIFLHPAEAQHGDLGLLQPNDILFLVSNSGKTREIIELTALAKNLDSALPLIVLTGNPETRAQMPWWLPPAVCRSRAWAVPVSVMNWLKHSACVCCQPARV